MARVTVDELRVVLGTQEYTQAEASDAELQSFIDSANLLVNEELSTSGLSDDRLALIEKYLAAHLAALTYEKGQVTFSKTGDASEYYGFKADKGLLSTRYGQLAVSLDTSGSLAAAATPNAKASFKLIAFKDDPKGYDDSCP